MPKTAQALEKLEKFRNREYTEKEAIADLATEIRGLIDDRLALNTAAEKMNLGLLVAGKSKTWTITRPVWDVTDTATGDLIPATEGELWRELRRRSGLDPRAFVLAMARAAGVPIPDVLRPESDDRRNNGAFDPAADLAQKDIDDWLGLTLFRCPLDGKIKYAQIGGMTYQTNPAPGGKNDANDNDESRRF